jgi:hypothetical protein
MLVPLFARLSLAHGATSAWAYCRILAAGGFLLFQHANTFGLLTKSR